MAEGAAGCAVAATAEAGDSGGEVVAVVSGGTIDVGVLVGVLGDG